MRYFSTSKKLCILSSLCLAGMAAMAHAEPQVNIYGNIDVGLVKETGSRTRMERGYFNWLGFRGREDLGDGLAAVFNLQMRFLPDTGVQETGVLWQGESTVGLQSASFGTVRLGRAMSPFWQQKWVYDPWWDSQMFGSLGAYQNGSYATDPSGALGYANWTRISNAVFYDSPALAGFSVHVAGEVDKQAGAAARTSGVSLNYGRGPLSAMLSYERNARTDEIYFLAASYNLGIATLMGSYSRNQLAGAARERNMVLAATIPVSADTIRTGYGRNQENRHDKASLGYVHALSKRTNAYADIYREKAAARTEGIALGMNHSFF